MWGEMEGQYYKFYVVRTMHFGMKLYNDQRNAQVFNLFASALHIRNNQLNAQISTTALCIYADSYMFRQ
jgi:hypothetical protein